MNTQKNEPKVLIVLPCRLGSTRLKEKHLLEFSNGKTISQMTYEACQKTKADRVVLATDDASIMDKAASFGAEAVMTKSTHISGSDRVAEVSKMFPEYDYVLNIQGDEPLVRPETINDLIDGIIESHAPLCTAMTDFHSIQALQSPSNVKVVCTLDDDAMYFSRSIIPFNRTAQNDASLLPLYRKHLGLYAYARDFLWGYSSLPKPRYETIESLEQLRILEAGHRIKMVYTPHDSIGIDTPQDAQHLEKILKAQASPSSA